MGLKIPISVDLETLALSPTAAVVEIAAVNMRTNAHFAVSICPDWYQDQWQFTIDQATVAWHKQKHSGYLTHMEQIGVSAPAAVVKFKQWLLEQDPDRTGLHLWVKGKDADIPWLSNLFANATEGRPVKLPWHYRNAHCARDLFQLYPEVTHRHTGNHTALRDALSQASHLKEIAAFCPRAYTMLFGEADDLYKH